MFCQLIVLCCLYVVWTLWFRRSSSDPPEFSGRLPFVGHGHLIIGNGAEMYKKLVKLSEECLAKGGVVTLQLGPFTTVYGITDPEDTLTVMNSCFEKHYFWDFSKPLVGLGLLTAKVPTWKKNRRLLIVAFNQQVLDGYIETFNDEAKNLVHRFASKVGTSFDPEFSIRMYALQAICATACGANPTEYTNYYYQYLMNVEKLLESITQRMVTIWYHREMFYNMTIEKLKLDKMMAQCHKLSESIIEKKQSEKSLPNIRLKSDKYKSFIDLAFDLGDSGYFTNEQIREEIDTIIMAAHDTTGSTLTFALTLLGSYPELQQKAYEEAIRVCGNSDKYVTKEGLSNLVYIEAVIKETLRLYPVTIVIARHVDKDLKLKKYKIKANTDCFLFLHGLHRHATWGADAGQFRPERWLDKDSLPDHKYYAAFGLGRRSCIVNYTITTATRHAVKRPAQARLSRAIHGQLEAVETDCSIAVGPAIHGQLEAAGIDCKLRLHSELPTCSRGKRYAMMSMKIVLSHIVRRYIISSDVSKMVPKFYTMTRPDCGHWITLEHRERIHTEQI